MWFVVCITERWNWDTWTGEEREEDCEDEEYDGEEHDAAEPHCDDDNFIVSQLIFTQSASQLLHGAEISWTTFSF